MYSKKGLRNYFITPISNLIKIRIKNFGDDLTEFKLYL